MRLACVPFCVCILLAWWCLAVKTVQTSSSQKGMCIWRQEPHTPVWILITGVWSYKTHQVKCNLKGCCLYWGYCLWDYSTRALTEDLAIPSTLRSIWNCQMLECSLQVFPGLGISQTDSLLKQLVLPKLCSRAQGCQKESLTSSDCMSHLPFHSGHLLIPSFLALCQNLLFVICVAQATTMINFSLWQFIFRHIDTL